MKKPEVIAFCGPYLPFDIQSDLEDEGVLVIHVTTEELKRVLEGTK